MLPEINNENNTTKKSSKKWIFLLLIIFMLISAFFVYGYTTKQLVFKENQTKQEYSFSLDEFVVNLKDPNASGYLKAKIALGYQEKKTGKVLEKNVSQIRDIVIQTLRNKTREQMMSVEGTDQLKKEIKEKVNVFLENNAIVNIYITDYLVQ